MNRRHMPYEELLDEVLADPQFAADLLSDALKSGDVDVFLLTLRDVLRVHGGVSAIAEKADISRSTLYSMLSMTGNPSFRNLLSVLDASGFEVQIGRRRRGSASRAQQVG